ncbi:MAG TPA: hypothetical protein VI485_06690 [Vicinamibacterales bacterium]|nr:hypothetical protein [Vicinamibacterales bacterium]
MSRFDAVCNLGLKAARRIQSAPKPLVRMLRRHAREQEHRAFRREAEDIDREIARLAGGTGPIIAGPWLAEVGYEVLYWIPFLRWFQDAHGIRRDRLVILSRGGMEAAYKDVAGGYVDIFDVTTPADLAARNAQRRAEGEGGGQKQSATSALDEELLRAARLRLGLGDSAVCHPSLMFRLFRNVWHGNLPFDLLWRHTRYVASSGPGPAEAGHYDRAQAVSAAALAALAGIPNDFIAVKVYAGPALSTGDATREAARMLVTQAASMAPVVLLDADLGIDEHRDFDLAAIPGVTSARALMTARTNLDVQMALIGRSRFFLSACGGLAWLAPFMGVPTVAIYDSDRLLAPHLFVARQAGALAGAAEFAPLDLRGLAQLGVMGRPASLTLPGRQP